MSHMVAHAPQPMTVLARLFGEMNARAILKCMSPAMLRGPLAALNLCAPTTPDEDIIALYFTEPMARQFSPNALFDEQWYRTAYPDVAKAIQAGLLLSGFIHFVCFGAQESRWPNSTLYALAQAQEQPYPTLKEIAAETYLHKNPQGILFLSHFPIFSPLEHYNLFGRKLGLLPHGERRRRPVTFDSKYYNILASEFDARFYVDTYHEGVQARPGRSGESPFQQYIIYGIAAVHSPNVWFDEAWYRAFYPDVRASIERGDIPCGFYHFLVTGRDEGRLPSYHRTRALEARMPGVTAPVLHHRIHELAARMRSIPVQLIEDRHDVIWFLLPTINPDLTFGGYKAAFELLLALDANGHRTGIICTQDPSADKTYFLWHKIPPALRALMKKIPVVNRATIQALQISPDDSFIAYSIWDLPMANMMAQETRKPKLFLFVQEYEPIFYDNGGMRVIAEETYNIPHYPIINSAFLVKYFAAHKIGVFGAKHSPVAFRDYAVFEHRINLLPAQTLSSMRQRKVKTLFAYARPEGHAARNLFEVLVLGLRAACKEKLFGDEWRFIGIGALAEHEPIPLGAGHELILLSKQSEEDYRKTVSAIDIGISLMYAPHPSVVPFEFATTGAIVVTNNFENRTDDDLTAFSKNIVPCDPSVTGLRDALRRAVSKVDDYKERSANRYHPAYTEWDQIFTPDWLKNVFGLPRQVVSDKNSITKARHRKAEILSIIPAISTRSPRLGNAKR